jgi:hypothetical protein
MAKLKAARGAQYPLTAEIVLDLANDTVVDVNGATKDLKTFGATVVFDAINLPPNAIVTEGELVTETAVSGSTAYNVTVGDILSSNRYLASTDKTAAGRTALVPTGYVGLGENVRLSVTPTVANSTGGKISLRVTYVIRNRMNEAQTH